MLTLNYSMLQNVHANGFLECNIDSEERFICNLITTENMSGGKKRKTRKHKKYTKYTKSKKTCKKYKKSKKTCKRNKKSKRRK